jgi:hydrogenase-4 component F
MSEFLIVSSTISRAPVLAVTMVIGLLVAFGALLLRLHGLAFGEPKGPSEPVQASYLPLAAHLALVLIAGVYLPPPLVAWFQHIATSLH